MSRRQVMAKKPKPKTKEQLTFEAGYTASLEDLGQKPDAKKMEQAFRDWKEENPQDTPIIKEWKLQGMPHEMLFGEVVYRFEKQPSGRYIFGAVRGGLFGPIEDEDADAKAARAGK
jgi:hypothetical protein